MATTSPNAASWYKPSMGGSRPASNQTGFGSGKAVASARRYLRSSRGGAEAVQQKYQAMDRADQYARADQLQQRQWQREDQKEKQQRDIFEKFLGGAGIPATAANFAQAQQPAAGVTQTLPAKPPANNFVQPLSNQAPPAPVQSGATFDGVPAAEFFQGAANRQGKANAFAAPTGFATGGTTQVKDTSWMPRGDLRAAGENLANLQAGGFQQQVPPMAPASAVPPPTAFTAPQQTVQPQAPAQAPSLAQAGAALNTLGGSVPTEPQYEIISPAGEMARGVGQAVNRNVIAPVAAKASELGITAAQNFAGAGKNISETMDKLKSNAATVTKPTIDAYESAKKFLTPVRKLK